jgi:hypothetical protein
MRQSTILPAVCLMMALTTFGDDEKKPIREITLKNFNPAKLDNAPKGTTLMTAEELAKAIPDKTVSDEIAKQVDFKSEYLVYFAWQGSGGDRIGFSAGGDKAKPIVTFGYKQGLTDDLRTHVKLFALSKDATWEMSKK